MYALVDCNNFYASCEKVFKPWLNGDPIVVLSNNDGCVIARSQEAKLLGIKMGEPSFKLKNIFKKYRVKVFSSNYTLYGSMSKRVMNMLSKYSPEIEIYSIDEAFLSFAGINYDLVEYSKNIRRDILQNLGLPICIGIGKTKTLAKVANRFAKKEIQHGGVVKITNFQDIKLNLKKLEVNDIWGIGKQYSYFLNKNGIYTAWQFVKTSDTWIRKNMTVVGLRIKKELLGIECNALEIESSPKKAIATTRSFGCMLNSNLSEDTNILKEAIASFASKCALKLRQQKSCCNVVTVFIMTNKHRKDLLQYYNSISLNFEVPTNSSIEIVKKSLIGFKHIFKKNFFFKKAGVIVSGIVPENEIQSNLFDIINRKKHYDLMKSVDYINYHEKFKSLKNDNYLTLQENLKISSCGYNKKWFLKKENLSKCYTTRWQDIIKINFF